MKPTLLAILVFGFCGTIRSAVDVCATWPGGVIDGATWTKAESPYRVRCNVYVSALTIEPGVDVVFEGNYVFKVQGILTAIGTASEPITFTSANSDTTTWKGVFFDNTQPGSELVHCIIEYANTSGIRLTQSIQTIEWCTIQNNTRSGAGGAIDVVIGSGDQILKNCMIRANKATSHGGAIRSSTGTGKLILEGCVITENVANPSHAIGNFFGGAIYATGTLQMDRCVLEDNLCWSYCNTDDCHAESKGGALYLDGNAILRNCVVASNESHARESFDEPYEWANSYGGGIYLYAGSLSIANCVVAWNRCTAAAVRDTPVLRGAGIYVNSGNAAIVNCTLAYNDVTGIYRSSGTVNVLNSIVYFNNASGAQIEGAATVTYSCVQGLRTGQGNIPYNPDFMDTARCLRLGTSSPCIDAGNPDPAYDDSCFPPSHRTVRNDMGAYGGPGGCDWHLPFDCDGNCEVDWVDLSEGASQDCNQNGIPDSCEIADNPELDADGDRQIDKCCARSARLVRKSSVPLMTYAVLIESDVPFYGGEVAVGVKPAYMTVRAVRRGTDLDGGAEVIFNPGDPSAQPPLTCAGGTPAGVTMAWYNPGEPPSLTPPGAHELFEIDLDFVAGAPGDGGATVEFVYCLGGVAGARVLNVITGEDGKSIPLCVSEGVVPHEPFVRGDVNDDSRFDISDPILVLVHLFSGPLHPTCPDAADVDDNAAIEITDAIYLLNWRFQGGPAPEAPYPGCGRDPTPEDTLGPCSASQCW